MIKIRYFARLSESLGLKAEELEYQPHWENAESVINALIDRGDIWAEEFSGENKILVAINQQMSERETAINDGDEVAFFPPVTGG